MNFTIMKKEKIIVIRPKDVMKVFDISYSSACRRLRDMKDAYDKQKHQFITLSDFAEYEDIPEERILELLQSKNKSA